MKNIVAVFIILFLVLPVVLIISVSSSSENQMVMVTQKNQDSAAGQFLNQVYTEAFKRMGLTFVYKQYPAVRNSFLSDSGMVDGELSRIYSYSQMHPNVIRVEESHWKSVFFAVARDRSINLNGWNSLLDTDYKVIYRRGILGCELNLPKVVRAENIDTVNDTYQGYRMLLSGRADIFVGAETDVLNLLEAEEFRSLLVVGIMEQFTAHAFLHKQHRKLVPRLSAILKEMKQEGLFAFYRNKSGLQMYFTDW